MDMSCIADCAAVLGEAVTPLNVGQVYVTLNRLEKAGLGGGCRG